MARLCRAYGAGRLGFLVADVDAPIEGERKRVTVLFADIKGSMELIEDIDPEEVRFIEHYESTSEKFGRHRSHEFYGQIGKFIAKHGIDRATRDSGS